jgi:serine/threonine protein kinase
VRALNLFMQIKREISIMKLVRHPNVVRLHEARLSFS